MGGGVSTTYDLPTIDRFARLCKTTTMKERVNALHISQIEGRQ